MDIMLGFEERHMQFLNLWYRNKQHLWGVEKHLISLKFQLELVRLSQCLNGSSILPICLAGRQCWLLLLKSWIASPRYQYPGVCVSVDPFD